MEPKKAPMASESEEYHVRWRWDEEFNLLLFATYTLNNRLSSTCVIDYYEV